jgi:putative endonuclease
VNELGPAAEEIVVRALRRAGYEILDRNVVIQQLGELDIVAQRDGVVCFVEVRSRRSAVLGEPWETVGPVKQKRLRRLAEAYLDRRRLDVPARFDVASVVWPTGGQPALDYFEGAFE